MERVVIKAFVGKRVDMFRIDYMEFSRINKHIRKKFHSCQIVCFYILENIKYTNISHLI